jgi:spore coat polysaccharide biosynthesis predicted glycosyltransferase SpsG
MNAKPRILFRADASATLGFGHLARICALVEEVESRGYEAVPLLGGDEAAVRSWAHDRGLTAHVRAWSPTQVIQEAEHPRTAAIVVDGPPLASVLVPKMPDDVRTVVIDDLGRLSYPMSAVVNHNVHAPELAASYPYAQRRLLGRRYLMLRKDIRRYLRGSCRPSSHGKLRVIVTFGGSDPVNATSRVLALVPAERPLELIVIAGPGFRCHDELAAAAAIARNTGHDVDVRRSPEDTGALFVSADAAICSAGGTLGELAYLGCPALGLAIAPDQVRSARTQATLGLIAAGLVFSDSDDDTLRDHMRAFLLDDELRAELRRHALATADSEGPRRIVDEAILG